MLVKAAMVCIFMVLVLLLDRIVNKLLVYCFKVSLLLFFNVYYAIIKFVSSVNL